MAFDESTVQEERQESSENDEVQNEELESENFGMTEEPTESENSEMPEEPTESEGFEMREEPIESEGSEMTEKPAESEGSEMTENSVESEEIQLPDSFDVPEVSVGTEGTEPGVNGDISTKEEMSSDAFPEMETEENAGEYREDFAAGERSEAVIFAGGDGTEENPYQVATAEQLDAVRNNLEACYVQVADIDLSGWNWEPIGYCYYQEEDGYFSPQYVKFTGKYYGNGYKISNLTIKQDNWLGNVIGLFGESNGFIENVTIEQCNIDLYCNNDSYTGDFC